MFPGTNLDLANWQSLPTIVDPQDLPKKVYLAWSGQLRLASTMEPILLDRNIFDNSVETLMILEFWMQVAIFWDTAKSFVPNILGWNFDHAFYAHICNMPKNFMQNYWTYYRLLKCWQLSDKLFRTEEVPTLKYFFCSIPSISFLYSYECKACQLSFINYWMRIVSCR